MDPSTPTRATFWLTARPIFRAADWYASYAGSLLERGSGLSGKRYADELAALAEERRGYQRTLGRLGEKHGDVCAQCKGQCCTEERFRDAFFDRVLQDPASENRSPRSLRQASRETHLGPAPLRGSVPAEDYPKDYCPNCSTQGCVLPYDSRPIQCGAYYCWGAICALSEQESREGIVALRGLMRIMGRVAGLAAATRFAG
jgi:hypothetical protein